MKDLRITSETIKGGIIGDRYLLGHHWRTGETPGTLKVPKSLSINELTLAQRMARNVELRKMQITREEALRVGYDRREIDALLPENVPPCPRAADYDPAIVLPAQLNETMTQIERERAASDARLAHDVDWLTREAEIQRAHGVRTIP